MLYFITFSIAITALLSWFLMQKNETLAKLFRVMLAGAVLVYVVQMFAVDHLDVATKFGIAFRDLLVLGGVGIVGTILTRQRLLSFPVVIAIIIVLQAFVLPRLSSSLEVGVMEDVDAQIEEARPFLPVHGLAEDGEFLVEIANSQDLNLLKLLQEQYGFTYEKAFSPNDVAQTTLDDFYVIDFDDTTDESTLDNFIYDVQSRAQHFYIENNEYITLDDMESRPVINKTNFTINDPGLEFSWGFTPMKMNELYTFLQKTPLRPFKKARLAILDTGIDAKHEDIAANYVSTQKKYDDDPKGHGTHCAGIAAAVSNNRLGIASYALNSDFVEVTSIKVLNSYGIGTQQGIIKGIIEAADSGTDVISMSLGGRSSDSKQRAYEKAVKYANKKGAIVIVAAGNSNRNAKDYAPANSRGAITVTAIDDQLQRAMFSNYINDVDMGIAAPGVNIYSLIPGNQYAAYNGTSMATPYVSGLVAMMKSINPEMTTEEVYQILNQTGIDTKNTTETGKLIQPLRALQQILD
ncbi:MAG: S8 family serine peptidase [Saprospiraceae bacterium]